MKNNKIQDLKTIPISIQDRLVKQKVCIIIPIIYALVLLLISLFTGSMKNMMLMTFPTDDNGKLCGFDYPYQDHVYFVDLQNLSRRVCVSECPFSSNKTLQCQPTSDIGCKQSSTPGFIVTIYDSKATQHSSGKFCFPMDKKFRQKILKQANLNSKQKFYANYETILFCVAMSPVFGIIFLLLIQFFSKQLIYICIFVGSIVITGLGIVFIAYKFNVDFSVTLIISIIFIGLGIIMFIFSILKRKQIKILTIYMKYSVKLMNQAWGIYIYIILYIIFTFVLAFICLFEVLAIWSYQTPTFSLKNVFLQNKSSIGVTLTILIMIQFLWGLSYLKQSFNFNISGNAVRYYFSPKKDKPQQDNKVSLSKIFEPFKIQLKYNFGTIIAGSFIILILTIPDFIYDLFSPKHKETFYGKCCTFLFHWLDDLLSLCRTDSMAYINISAMDYCQSSRTCEALYKRSHIFRNTQQLVRFYVYGAHLLIISIIGIIGLYKTGDIAIQSELLILVLSLFLVTYFITIHSDAMEALIISFILDEQISKGIQYMEKSPKGLLDAVIQYSKEMNEPLRENDNQV